MTDGYMRVWICAAVAAVSIGNGARAAAPPNVLFIVADDQRANLGCYGDTHAKTPNLDKLASAGTLFRRAYVQQAVCAPSRASLLTGLRPDTVKVYDLKTPVRTHLPSVLTLPEDFKKHGYFSRAIGKIYHPNVDDAQSWSMPTFSGPEVVGSTNETSGTIGGPASATQETSGTRKGGSRGPSWFAPDLPDSEFHDGVVTQEAIKALKQLKDRPFFLAVGYNRPHLPLVAPKRFFDLYKGSEPPLAKNIFPPASVPEIALTNFSELRQYRDIPASGTLSLEKAREVTLAYYACTSFVDAQVGRLLDELKSLKLDENTIVIFLGDHGFALGENSIWGKHTNFEAATRAPLIFRVPGGQTSASVNSIVEFVDIYPTLAELCGWKPEAAQGKSLVSILKGGASGMPVEGMALSQYPRGKVMGYSLRTDQYRYTEWRKENGDIQDRELYDHGIDEAENNNTAAGPTHHDLMQRLHAQIEFILTK